MMRYANRKYRLLVLLVMVGILFAACAPARPAAESTPTAAPSEAAPQPPADTPAPTATAPAPAENQVPTPPAAVLAQKDLAGKLNLSADAVKITSVEQVEWPNGCLGIVTPGIMCTDMVVPGYKVMLEAGGKTYEYRTDLEGKAVKQAVDPLAVPTEKAPTSGLDVPVNPADLPPAVVKARETLAQQIQAKAADIQVDKIERVEWPNGCLGVQMPGRMCTQMIVPGYRVIFSYQGKQYEFHTDEAGGSIAMASAPLPQTMDKVITWQQTENNACSRVEIGVQTSAFGPCSGQLQEAQIQPARLEELRTLLSTYAPFNANTPSGSVFFNGQGTQQATPAEQRSIAEWAKLVKMEAESGRSGAAWGLAFGWHREGGIAGFCDDMGVYLSGWAQPSSCKGSNPASKPAFRLNAGQLAQLYAWVDQYQNFEYDMKDPANVSDAMSTRLTFAGGGTQKASADVQAQIAQFAADLYSSAPQ